MKCICCKKNFKTTPDERAGFRAAGFYTPAWWVRDQSVDKDAMRAVGADPDDWNNMICFDCAEKASEIEREKYNNDCDAPIKVVESHRRKIKENKVADAILDLVYQFQEEGDVNKIAADRFTKAFNEGRVSDEDLDVLYSGLEAGFFDRELTKKICRIIYKYSSVNEASNKTFCIKYNDENLGVGWVSKDSKPTKNYEEAMTFDDRESAEKKMKELDEIYDTHFQVKPYKK